MKHFILIVAVLVLAVGLAPQAEAQTKHSVSLAWTQTQQTGITVTDFNMYRTTQCGVLSSYVIIGHTGSGTILTFTDNSVAANTTYCYQVSAVSSTGQESAYSNEAKAVVPQDIQAPTSLTVTKVQ
jgi:UDP-N-acetylglucosamine transferase subunit ALG13